DPCGALQTRIELPPNTQFDLVFLLGEAASEGDAQRLIVKYRATGIEQVLAEVAAQWDGLLDTVQVRTPDRAMDIMLNDWLLVPGAELPRVGACRLLPGEWCL
ncbi:hypothetical protein JKG47_23185, partial [Acidithiobacillus sp. MC6.1]|nr:hypothetical protein [Acidithiobacillus sp. MC6.1]